MLEKHRLGIDLQLNAIPVQTNDFTWNTTLYLVYGTAAKFDALWAKRKRQKM